MGNTVAGEREQSAHHSGRAGTVNRELPEPHRPVVPSRESAC